LLLVPVLIGLNGFFVAAEYSLVRSRADRIDALVKEGVKGARLARTQIEHIDEYIAACQVGITFTSIGLGAVGEPVLADLLEGPLDSPLNHGAAVAIAGVIGYAFLSAGHVVLGELVPKVYTVVHAEGVARRLSRPLQFAFRLFTPITHLLTWLAGLILRPLGIRVGEVGEEETTSEDLKFLIARSATGGTLDPGEAGMLAGVFHLHEQQARNVMTPFPAVVTIDISEDVQTALRRCIASGHTRLIVIEDDNPDRVKGFVHNNSLSRLLMEVGPAASIAPVVKEVPIAPETKPLDDLLADLQKERVSLAVIVDEYGRTAGLVTIEDIIEEIVGEIADETDPAVAPVRRLANGDWYARGHVPITDLADYGIDLPTDSDAYNSVGGFVFAQLGRLPKRGDMVRVNGYSVRVESVRENRVEAVRIRDHEPERREGDDDRGDPQRTGRNGSGSVRERE
jgi:CBS domain containing-hemolysin-like protein